MTRFGWLLVGLLCVCAEARAQTKSTRPASHGSPVGGPPAATLRTRFGIESATRLMRSTDPDQRLRGVERAATMHTPEALTLLQRAAGASVPGAFDPHAPIDGVARGDPRALIAVVRGLAAWADRESARSALSAIVSGPTQLFATRVASLPTSDPAADDSEGAARVALAREEAAIALADSGGQLAIEALVAIARSGGPGQNAALEALAIHPPPWPVLGGVALTTPAMIALASSVGDLRSLDAIEGALHASDAGLRASALEALGDARDARVVEAARSAASDADARVRLAAAAALVRLGSPDAPQTVETLVADDSTARAALRIAREVQGEGIVRAAAARAVASADRELRIAALDVLGHQSSPSAVGVLVQLVGDPLLEGDAACALARSPSAAAIPALQKLAAVPTTRRLAARAYFVRRLERAERSAALDALLGSMAASPEGGDRAIATEALVAFGERPLDLALRDHDPRVRRAAAMGSMSTREPAAAGVLLAALAVETDTSTRQVLALGLSDSGAAAGVPTSLLLDRAEAGNADAPLAALSLARRWNDESKARVDALLTSRDPLLRAHAALGLGESGAPDATGRLARAYSWEPVAPVRRAIVAALGQHDRGPEIAPSLRETLGWAARLDPDRIVRRIAARELAGARVSVRQSRTDVAWIRLVPAPGASLPPGATAALVTSDGLAHPVAFDDEGYALLPGVSPGGASLRLAPQLPAYESAGP
jgi:HEAT repeat protein